MAGKKRYTPEEVVDAITLSRGKISLAAVALGCTTATIRNYRDAYPEVAEALENSRMEFDDSLLDAAEIRLDEAVHNGERWAIRYVLDRKGKGRGYIPASELRHAGPDGGAVQVEWVDPLGDDDDIGIGAEEFTPGDADEQPPTD